MIPGVRDNRRRNMLSRSELERSSPRLYNLWVKKKYGLAPTGLEKGRLALRVTDCASFCVHIDTRSYFCRHC